MDASKISETLNESPRHSAPLADVACGLAGEFAQDLIEEMVGLASDLAKDELGRRHGVAPESPDSQLDAQLPESILQRAKTSTELGLPEEPTAQETHTEPQ